MAGTRISALSRRRLARRMPDRETMIARAGAWEKKRNGAAVPVDWRFRVEQVRCRLKSLYPSIQ